MGLGAQRTPCPGCQLPPRAPLPGFLQGEPGANTVTAAPEGGGEEPRREERGDEDEDGDNERDPEKVRARALAALVEWPCGCAGEGRSRIPRTEVMGVLVAASRFYVLFGSNSPMGSPTFSQSVVQGRSPCCVTITSV